MTPQINVRTMNLELNVPRAEVCLRDQTVCTKNDCDNTMLGKASKRVRADDRGPAHWETLVLIPKIR